jgi:hypothetical protein
MIDSVSKEVPDLEQMIEGTLRRGMRVGEWNLVTAHFVDLYHIMATKGHIPDEEFLKRGFPADTNCRGEEVHRSSDIAQGEHMHRAKLMDHDYQVKLRSEKMNEMVQKELAKQDKEKEKIDGRLRNNLRSCIRWRDRWHGRLLPIS